MQISIFFRNFAVQNCGYERAAGNLPAGIIRTTEYLQLFLRNILLGEKNELRNRYLHVDWKDEEKHVEKGADKKPKTSDRIVAAMKADPYVTGEMLQAQLGLSRRGIEDGIDRLRKRGRIYREGDDNGGKWVATSFNRKSK